MRLMLIVIEKLPGFSSDRANQAMLPKRAVRAGVPGTRDGQAAALRSVPAAAKTTAANRLAATVSHRLLD
jgi:hypothetical protein